MKRLLWLRMPYGKLEGRETFNGNVIYPASCISKDNMNIMISGGCNRLGYSMENAYICKDIWKYKIIEEQEVKPMVFERIVNMIYPRYGHALITIQDSVFAVGGYQSSEEQGEPP
jgi:hypothetical protein